MPCFLQTLCTFALANGTRGVAQLVSAPRSGRGGRKFESSHPDKSRDLLIAILYFFHPQILGCKFAIEEYFSYFCHIYHTYIICLQSHYEQTIPTSY